MKKVLLFILILSFVFSFLPIPKNVSRIYALPQRKVLVELFTATWCGPCAAYGPNADKLYDELGSDKVVLLRNQVWDDGLDTEETNNRCDLYGVNGVPSLFVNGMFEFHPADYDNYKSKVNSILQTTPKCEISITPQIQSGKSIGTVSVKVDVINPVNSKNTRLVVALVEKLVYYEGRNKEKTHRFVVRDYLIDEMGSHIDFNSSGSLYLSLPFYLKEGVNPNDFFIAAWVQDYSTKEVLQAETSDISVVSTPVTPCIISPSTSSTIPTLPLKIKWISPYSSFRLQISDKQDFSNLIVDKDTIIKEEIISNLSQGKYFLRIKSKEDSLESSWSQVVTFTYSPSQFVSGWKDYNFNLYGGNVTSIVQDPKNPAIFYAGTYGGGVFKSIDSGKTWKKSSNGLENLYVKSLAMDQDNPNRIFAGTDRGVFVTNDNGNSWLFCGGPSYIKKVEYATQTKTLYVLSDYYFYDSTDYGKTFEGLSLPINGQFYYETFSVDPKNQNRIFVSLYKFSDYIPLLYLSSDGGKNWSKIMQCEKYQMLDDVAFDVNGNIYLAVSGKGILKSIDGGNTFNKINSPSDYVYKIAFSPFDPNLILVIEGSRLNISLNGGVSWQMANFHTNSLSYPYCACVAFDKLNSNRILVGTERKGVLVSENIGNNWVSLNEGIYASKVISILTLPDFLVQTGDGFYKFKNNWTHITSGDDEHRDFESFVKAFQNPKNPMEIVLCGSDSIAYSSNTGMNWKFLSSPNRTYSYSNAFDIDFQNKLVYIFLYNWSDGSDYLYKTDFQGNWEKISILPADVKYWGISFALDHNSPNIFYLGAETYWDSNSKTYKGGGLYKSTDSGKNWTLFSLKNESVNGIFIDPEDSKTVFANTDDGLKKSTNGGITWKTVFNKSFKIMTFSGSQPIIYASFGRNVLQSKDNGDTWDYVPWDYSVDLIKPSKINTIAIDPQESSNFFIGTDNGVFKYNGIAIDITAPKVEIISPENNFKTNFSTVKIVGKATDNVGVVGVWVGSKKADLAQDGTFEGTIDLIEGTNTIKVTAYDAAGNKSETTVTVIYEIPTFKINSSFSTGGTISPSGIISVNYGDSKTFVITPSPGYKVSTVKVDGKSVGSVSSYTFTNITQDHTIEAIFEKGELVIVLKIGDSNFTVNGEPHYPPLDSPPIIKNGRTLLPIRAVVEALGGTVGWDAKTQAVTIRLGYNTIVLQIGNANASVNGQDKYIDPQNLKVVPEIINSRTMLPLRFVTENLGCTVDWDAVTNTVTITYIE